MKTPRSFPPLVRVFAELILLGLAAALVGCSGAPRSVYGSLGNTAGGNTAGLNGGGLNSGANSNGQNGGWDPTNPFGGSAGSGSQNWGAGGNQYVALDAERCANMGDVSLSASRVVAGTGLPDNTYYGGWTDGRTGYALNYDKNCNQGQFQQIFGDAEQAVGGDGSSLPLYPSYGTLSYSSGGTPQPIYPAGPAPWHDVIAPLAVSLASSCSSMPSLYTLIAFCVASCFHPDQVVATANASGIAFDQNSYDPSNNRALQGMYNTYLNDIQTHGSITVHQFVYALQTSSVLGSLKLASTQILQMIGSPQREGELKAYYVFHTLDGDVTVTDAHPMITGDGSVYTAKHLAEYFQSHQDIPDATLLKADGSSSAIMSVDIEQLTVNAINLITDSLNADGSWSPDDMLKDTVVVPAMGSNANGSFVLGTYRLQEMLAGDSTIDGKGVVHPSLAQLNKELDGLHIPDIFVQ